MRTEGDPLASVVFRIRRNSRFVFSTTGEPCAIWFASKMNESSAAHEYPKTFPLFIGRQNRGSRQSGNGVMTVFVGHSVSSQASRDSRGHFTCISRHSDVGLELAAVAAQLITLGH